MHHLARSRARSPNPIRGCHCPICGCRPPHLRLPPPHPQFPLPLSGPNRTPTGPPINPTVALTRIKETRSRTQASLRIGIIHGYHPPESPRATIVNSNLQHQPRTADLQSTTGPTAAPSCMQPPEQLQPHPRSALHYLPSLAPDYALLSSSVLNNFAGISCPPVTLGRGTRP